MYFAVKLVYLIVLASVQLPVKAEEVYSLSQDLSLSNMIFELRTSTLLLMAAISL